ncbi:MAG TPA: GntR family transcriptional regulator [Ktedonobacterales bacterium]|jgi:DNA-binding GntR family transcriptional regulator|nr:GntR family transcriptional regulator [Ktedonobacterales bacterium]
MPLPETPPVTRVCLSDAAYERLRDWILDGTLIPGEALRDEALADALGMSRTPVRDALQRLETEGLVLSTPTRRTYVSPVTTEQAHQIYPIAAHLEALALQLACPHLDAGTLATMTAANTRLNDALQQGDPSAAMAADQELHNGFIAHCGNEQLIALLRDLRYKVRRIERAFWSSADRMPSVRDHAELIAALRANDLDAAQRILARNWQHSLIWTATERTASREG